MGNVDIHGYQIEQGHRNYRPEYPADHPRVHRAMAIPSDRIDSILAKTKALNALHRAAWIAAAYEGDAIFLDMMQSAEPLPAVEPGDVWCGILNDDEPTRGGSKGPAFFDRRTLIRLVALAKSIIVNAAGVNPEIYMLGPELTAKNRQTSLLIETEPRFEAEWYAFVLQHKRDARCTLVTPNPFDPLQFRVLSTEKPHDETPS